MKRSRAEPWRVPVRDSAAGFNTACLTVDWEDFGQLNCSYYTRTAPNPRPDIDRQTRIVLELLAETGTKATFFCLGMLARHRVDLLRRIHAEGHEVAVHGTNHVQFTRLDVDAVRRDIADSVALVSDITGARVHGFRAPVFSITRQNLHVLEVLSELGLRYDSSIFPKELVRYGIAGFDPCPRNYELPHGGHIVELPLTVMSWAGADWPVSGGGYLRLVPERLLGPISRRVHQAKRPFIVYTHPYEFDSEPLDVTSDIPHGMCFSRARRTALNVRWNLFRKSLTQKVRFLLQTLRFVTCQELADDCERSDCTPLLG